MADTPGITTESDFNTARQALFNTLKSRSYQYREEPFTLKSGAQSHHYVDCRLTTLDGVGAALVAELFLYLLHRFAPDVTAIGGLTVGADPIVGAVIATSFYVDDEPTLNGFIVRSAKKDHGAKDLVIGAPNIPAGTLVAICDDVLTSGGSLLETHRAVQELELNPRLVLVIVDREEQGGRAAVEQAIRVPVLSLFTLRDFAEDVALRPFDFMALSPAA